MKQWEGFQGGAWEKEINVRDFIQQNITVYTGDDAFLAPATEATNQLWKQVMDLSKQERDNGGVLDMDTEIVSTITSHGPGYLNKDLEAVVGVQTDKPFKRSLQPFGGIRMAEQACESYGFKVSEEVSRIFTDIRKTHNQGVFDAYTDEMKLARKAAIITGLPDAYGRGRIIGDYRRVALYGIDHLIAEKKKDLANTGLRTMSDDIIRLREELNEQIRALNELKKLGKAYGFDLSQPAQTAKEAFQWLYLGYLAAIKEQNGAAMSLGRTSTFLDIYVERDLKAGVINEQQAQELVDHFVM
ncbi:pyruvate formate lyase family protein, partial [Paenibacillus sp. YN15]|uniref:pyruvate formate lyase family protein n=1 Tax=Paenibacillus sp. YN15 TaxID=1742774 RepID=UPI000DCCE651